MILRLKPKVDISYGVYLWGFPVQQIIAKYFKDHGILFNQSASLVAALFLAISHGICAKSTSSDLAQHSLLLLRKPKRQ